MSFRSDGTDVHILAARGNPGIIRVFGEVASDLHRSRHVLWQLFRRDFVAQFRQRLLGYLWIAIVPLLTLLQFVFMNKAGVLNPGETPVPYPVFAFFGIGLWTMLVGVVQALGEGLVKHKDIVIRTNVPKISLALSGMAPTLYNLLVNLLLLGAILLVYGVTPSWQALLYPLFVLPLLALGTGIGLVIAVMGAVLRDLSDMARFGLMFLMFLTPVAYRIDFGASKLQRLVEWNPMTHLINVPRDLFFLGRSPDMLAYGLSSAGALFALALAVWWFDVVKDKVAEQL